MDNEELDADPTAEPTAELVLAPSQEISFSGSAQGNVLRPAFGRSTVTFLTLMK